MNALRKLSSSKLKATRHTVTISRAEGSLGLGLSDDNCVTSIVEGSSAASADVQVGDRVVSIGGQPVGARKLVSLLAENTRSEIHLEIERRASTERKGSITQRLPFSSKRTASRSASDVPADGELTRRSGSFAEAGETVMTMRISRKADDEPWGLEVDETNNVSAVMWDSVACRAGFLVGDEVTKVDGHDLGEQTIIGDEAISSVFETALAVTLTVRRGKSLQSVISFTTRRNSADI